MKILIGYASAHGSTAEIAAFMGRVLSAYDVDVTVSPLRNVTDGSGYDAFIVGSPIHASMWLQEMSLFFDRVGAAMRDKPSYLFVTCIRIMEADGMTHTMEYYLHHPTLEKVGIPTSNVKILAGKIDLNSVTWDERWLLSSNYDGSEASKLVNHDYRDWETVGHWSHEIAKALRLSPKF